MLVTLLVTGITDSQADAQWWKRRKEKRYARKHKHDQEAGQNN